jgi:uncharacterized protein YwqG
MAKKPPDLVQQLAPWFERNKRPAWKPVVEAGDNPITASKFAGTPWLAPGESWPTCGNCKQAMRLFVQVNLATVPKDLETRFGTGLLQLFVCIKEDCLYMQAYGDPFSKCLLARLVQPEGRAASIKIPLFNDQFNGPFPAKMITGWGKLDDYPSSQDFSDLGLNFPNDSLRRMGSAPREYLVGRLECKELGFAAEIPADDYYPLDRCIAGEKLAGWADWVQVHTSYPNCPRCNKRMDTIVFQIGSEDNIPFMFADGGQGPITQCPDHKDVLGFNWDSG